MLGIVVSEEDLDCVRTSSGKHATSFSTWHEPSPVSQNCMAVTRGARCMHMVSFHITDELFLYERVFEEDVSIC